MCFSNFMYGQQKRRSKYQEIIQTIDKSENNDYQRLEFRLKSVNTIIIMAIKI